MSLSLSAVPFSLSLGIDWCNSHRHQLAPCTFRITRCLGAVFLDYEPARNILKSYLFVTSTNCKPIERKLQVKTVAFLAIRESDSNS